MDEPSPLGEREGPIASRMLCAAAANCLTKTMDEVPGHSINTEATCRLVRDEKKRLRVGGIDVRLRVEGLLEDSRRLKPCVDLFEDFCVVSASIRQGIPIGVEVVNGTGEVLHRSV